MLERFVQACRQQQSKPTVVCAKTLVVFAGWAAGVVADIGSITDIPCANDGYIAKFIVRKLVLAELAASDAHAMDWAEVLHLQYTSIGDDVRGR